MTFRRTTRTTGRSRRSRRSRSRRRRQRSRRCRRRLFKGGEGLVSDIRNILKDTGEPEEYRNEEAYQELIRYVTNRINKDYAEQGKELVTYTEVDNIISELFYEQMLAKLTENMRGLQSELKRSDDILHNASNLLTSKPHSELFQDNSNVFGNRASSSTALESQRQAYLNRINDSYDLLPAHSRAAPIITDNDAVYDDAVYDDAITNERPFNPANVLTAASVGAPSATLRTPFAIDRGPSATFRTPSASNKRKTNAVSMSDILGSASQYASQVTKRKKQLT